MKLHINQEPVSVSYTCCDCGSDIIQPYDKFCAPHGENPYDDWDGKELCCPCCNAVDTIDDFEFD